VVVQKKRPGEEDLELLSHTQSHQPFLRKFEIVNQKPVAVRDLTGWGVGLTVQRRAPGSDETEPLLPVDKEVTSALCLSATTTHTAQRCCPTYLARTLSTAQTQHANAQHSRVSVTEPLLPVDKGGAASAVS
jgi:hypothetical protein